MAKKELIIDTAQFRQRKNLNLIQRLESSSVVRTLSEIYSNLLEERISPRRTLKLVHAQFAMGVLLLLGGMSVFVAILLCAWAVLAIWQCKM